MRCLSGHVGTEVYTARISSRPCRRCWMAKPPEVNEFFSKHPAPYHCEFIASDFDPGFEDQSASNENQAAYVRAGYHEESQAKP